jgi:hypothetical protein
MPPRCCQGECLGNEGGRTPAHVNEHLPAPPSTPCSCNPATDYCLRNNVANHFKPFTMDKFQAFGKNIRCVLADERNFEGCRERSAGRPKLLTLLT